MATRIQLRRDTAANWTSNNPVLADGEPGYEKDTGFFKYGNGVDDWNTLPYSSTGGSQGATGVAGLQGDTGLQGVTGPAGVGGGGGGTVSEFEIRLAAGTNIADMITSAPSIPSGWNLDDGVATLGNVTPTGLGTLGSSDLVVEHGTTSYVVNVEIIQFANSGPPTIQGYYNQHYDNTAANFRSNTAGSQFAYFNFLAITASSRQTYLIVRLASV